MNFNHSPFWVQVHDMPLVCMNREIEHKIKITLGMVEDVYVTGDGVGWGHCLCIRVHLDVTKPLEQGHALMINGKFAWVSFKYEKLPQFCYTCGQIYHELFSCNGN
jgi:hypothetical protein